MRQTTKDSNGEREISGAPPLCLELTATIAFGLLIAWWAPDLNSWIRGAAPVHTPAPDCRAATERAEKFATVIVAALEW